MARSCDVLGKSFRDDLVLGGYLLPLRKFFFREEARVFTLGAQQYAPRLDIDVPLDAG